MERLTGIKRGEEIGEGNQASCFAVVKHLGGYKVNELFVLVFS